MISNGSSCIAAFFSFSCVALEKITDADIASVLNEISELTIDILRDLFSTASPRIPNAACKFDINVSDRSLAALGEIHWSPKAARA